MRARVEEDQRIMVLSRDAEAKRVPSLENLTHDTAPSWPRKAFTCRYGLYGGSCCPLPLLAIATLETTSLSNRLSLYIYTRSHSSSNKAPLLN